MGVEIDGSFGRLDVDLAVEAMNMLGLWKSRVTLMGRLCRSGMISGTVSGVQLVVVLARDDVSGPVESVLYIPMPLEPDGDLFGLGVGHG